MQNRYCVYLHRRKDNGELFYVGQGLTKSRPSFTRRKNKRWQEIAKSVGFYVEIYKDNLTKEDALRIESELISQYEGVLVNRKWAVSAHKELSFEFFNELFYVNDESKTGLSRKTDRYAKNTLMATKDSDAGILGEDGYYYISVCGATYRVHRIVYLLTHKYLQKDLVIDHIDRVKTNNSVVNLRAVTHAQNQQNRTLDIRSKTSISGVSLKSKGIYESTMSTESKRISKSFSISKYGKEEAFRLACEWRKQMEELHRK